MKPLEADEFYMEDGKFVLTERFHLRRGHCCGNACRHCPFDHSAVAAEVRARKPSPYPHFEFVQGELGSISETKNP